MPNTTLTSLQEKIKKLENGVLNPKNQKNHYTANQCSELGVKSLLLSGIIKTFNSSTRSERDLVNALRAVEELEFSIESVLNQRSESEIYQIKKSDFVGITELVKKKSGEMLLGSQSSHAISVSCQDDSSIFAMFSGDDPDRYLVIKLIIMQGKHSIACEYKTKISRPDLNISKCLFSFSDLKFSYPLSNDIAIKSYSVNAIEGSGFYGKMEGINSVINEMISLTNFCAADESILGEGYSRKSAIRELKHVLTGKKFTNKRNYPAEMNM